MKYGNIAIEASNKLGMKRDELKKANASSKKHPMPNANVKINKQALIEAEALNNGQGDYNEENEEDEIFDTVDFDS